MSALRDAARLLLYFAATVLAGALIAPLLYWGAQSLADHGVLRSLARHDFETFFHRALLVAAVALLWPLLRALRIKGRAGFGLLPNQRWGRDTIIGFVIAALPLLCAAEVLLTLGFYKLRGSVSVLPILTVTLSAIAVPFLEEALFRGLILGVLLRSGRPTLAVFLSAAIFSILHFLKAPEHTTDAPSWSSGFVSIAHAFGQFSDPMLLLAGFTTLFLIGCILADARVRTKSLWCSIGLHSGWILANGIFNKLAHREILALPWLGKNLLVGIVPLGVGLLSWGVLHLWLKYGRERAA